jgi:hypothetical protein
LRRKLKQQLRRQKVAMKWNFDLVHNQTESPILDIDRRSYGDVSHESVCDSAVLTNRCISHPRAATNANSTTDYLYRKVDGLLPQSVAAGKRLDGLSFIT